MSRLNSVLELVLIVAVLAVGVVIWRADQHAQRAQERDLCLQKIETAATISLLAPSDSVDQRGRLQAMKLLGERTDKC